MKVAVTHTAALSAHGTGTRGLAHALAAGAALRGMPADEPLANPRARKMMSRAAYLAARCLADLARETAWTEPETIGCFLGVGGSGGSLEDVIALLEASIVDGVFSLPRFGDRGLAACHPLLAFQLMNNFTMCHGAILEGLRGPNSAFFSRGAGTIVALAEAVYAVRSGECPRAITGGADTPTHPVAYSELAREGFVARGLVPADGVALLALAPSTSTDDVVVDRVAYVSGRAGPDAISAVVGPLATCDIVVLSSWEPDALRDVARARFPAAALVDTRALGESLAASAALAVCAAVDALRDRAGRAVVLTLGVDGDPCAVALSRGAA
ncbi:MAG TPA: beta-ketoacyl synthase N-terminal-like domain-containing protein [Kofleriaceae bacterium]|nr:beta-ketoacyl synthase N-terminal-like domain-containing protein [Kofleriaceae bacterium]